MITVTTNSGDSATSQPEKTARHKRGSGRERVLDAYAQVLREEGETAATLDEVARRADISKGGLLHHFGSKEALMEGLLGRMKELNEQDIAATMRAGGDGIAAYLHSSMQAEDDYSDTFIAILKLAGSGHENVDQALRAAFNAWQDELDKVISDPVLSRLVQLVGDGLYVHALIGRDVDELDLQVIDRLTKRTES